MMYAKLILINEDETYEAPTQKSFMEVVDECMNDPDATIVIQYKDGTVWDKEYNHGETPRRRGIECGWMITGDWEAYFGEVE